MNEPLAMREAPASYQVVPESPRVRPGYKQTEVGVIPEDWECLPIADSIDLLTGCPFPSSGYSNSGIRLLRGSNVKRGITDWSEDGTEYWSSVTADIRKYVLKSGDIVIAMDGSLVGRSFAMLSDGDVPSLLLQRVARVRSNSIDQKYLKAWVCSQRFTEHCDAVKTVSAIPHISPGDIRTFKIAFPPTKAEQEAIAEALSDADALIESLEQLITKKRHLKQGAMQQLLTGKKRLPGFSGEWDVKTFAELFDFSGGYSASRDQLSSEGHCYLHYGDIHKSSKTFIDVRAEYQDIPKLDVPLKRVTPVALLDDGDVVFVDASEDDEGTSKHVVIINKDKTPYISGLHTIVAKSKTDTLDHKYRRYCFQTPDIKRQFYYFAVGTKVSGISKTNIAKLLLPVPPLPEQIAIATLLSDMDTEIAALEAKLTKTRQIKQGMMHNLLTGKVRLVKPSVVKDKQHAPMSGNSAARNTTEKPHNWQINEAVVISMLADRFGKPDFPLGRKRYTKLSYLLHRKAEREAQGYLKKAAGPYNPKTKYAGPEKIAQENGYVRYHDNGKYKGFIAAENIEQAKAYFAKWYGAEIAAWLEQFRLAKNDELECLATVDMAMQELHRQGKTADVVGVRALIASEPEWLPKLERTVFSNAGIAAAIAQSQTLFGSD